MDAGARQGIKLEGITQKFNPNIYRAFLESLSNSRSTFPNFCRANFPKRLQTYESGICALSEHLPLGY
jgi:hypothetical protein